MDYSTIEKHFTLPNAFPNFNQHKRVPRKFKKRWKHILQAERYSHLTLGQKLWYIQHLTNRNYNRFLIKNVIQLHNERHETVTGSLQ